MIVLIILVIACVFQSWWILLLGLLIHDYFQANRIKELEERIEELEEK